MKVLFAASECAPMVKVGGLADVVGSLPKAVRALGVEVAIALPNYQSLPKDRLEVLPGTDIPIFYLGRQEDFPGEIYPGGYQEHERFANFSRQIANFLETRQFEPQIIHCHDYHTSLVPDIIKQRKIKVATVLTIHDIQNQGITTDLSVLELAGLGSSFLKSLDFDLSDKNLSFLLQGIISSDVVNTVSPTYAREILRSEVSGELAEILMGREARLYGILNGIDVNFYNPSRDSLIDEHYGFNNFSEGKKTNKIKLQKILGLAKEGAAPLFAMVTRLVARKGLDLILEVSPKIIENGAQVVILGKGEPSYEEALLNLSQRFAGKLSFSKLFDEKLAHQIYAASDFFLVPSLTEPCGLTQMIASRYGSLPIVRATGGLADTVEDGLTGFVFEKASPEAFWSKVEEALSLYKEKDRLSTFIGSAMKKNFSWEKSARSYLKLYEKALEYSFGIARGASGEIRPDILGGWSILAAGRAKRPLEKIQNSEPRTQDLDICPFDEGHEKESPGEIFRVGPGEPDTPGWQVRVIPNKYPILAAHEVVIHSPDHLKDLEDLPLIWVEKVVWAYLSRYRHYEEKGYVHIFCNHGRAAAASLAHPHSQIVVLDELTKATINALESAQSYYQDHGHCPYCDVLEREKENGPHFVYENNSMLLLTPYSSQWPYELTILPKHHRQSFGNISEIELKDLARVLQIAIKAVKAQFKDLSYNFWIHSVPDLLGFSRSALFYHWHVDIVPRVKLLGGLELGAGVMVDDLISPEEAATKLRNDISSFN